MAEIKYIQNKEEYGIDYDWKIINKRLKSLKIPDGVFYPDLKPIIEGCKLNLYLSERSTGKTTGWLLVGLCMNAEYGTVVEYVRGTEDEIRPSTAKELVKVITSYDDGRYIKILTDGVYNTLTYHWKAFYYAYRDETGEIVKTAPEPCIQMLAINKHLEYKSTFNAPKGDFIIFDEFIRKYYRVDEFWDFLDLVKTIQRTRLSPIVTMTANTLNRNSQYFEEMEISKLVKNMKLGGKATHVTSMGTKMYIELLNVETARKKAKLSNILFYGFNNPKISSITGENLWNFEKLPHIFEDDTKILLFNKLYMEISTELLKLDIYNSSIGLIIECHKATRTYEDSYILTLDYIQPDTQKNYGTYVYGLGLIDSKMNKVIRQLINSKKVFFSSNEVGNLFYEYIERFKKS